MQGSFSQSGSCYSAPRVYHESKDVNVEYFYNWREIKHLWNGKLALHFLLHRLEVIREFLERILQCNILMERELLLLDVRLGFLTSSCVQLDAVISLTQR